jgi:HTH-type transcriptional regulator, cell division transcriptional repressor
MSGAEPDGSVESAQSDYSDAASTFGDRVTLAREALGLDQVGLADKLGIKVKTLRNWEEDRAEPRANKLQMLAGVLNVSMIWLMSGRGMQPDFAGNTTQRVVDECLCELQSLQGQQRQITERLYSVERRLRLAFDGIETAA